MAEAIAPRAILKGKDHGAGQSRKLAEPGGDRHGPAVHGAGNPMRATTPGDAFLAAIAPILAAAGPLPHARLDTGG